MTKDQIQAWLIEYAWLGSEDEQRREVECIMSQADWEYLETRIDRTKGQAFDDEQKKEAEGFELSALYECHDGPHLATCPRANDGN